MKEHSFEQRFARWFCVEMDENIKPTYFKLGNDQEGRPYSDNIFAYQGKPSGTGSYNYSKETVTQSW